VVVSITQSSPFDPATDTNCEFPPFSWRQKLTAEYDKVGVSFVSIFILTYHIFFWVFGLAHSLSWDYDPGVPQGKAANDRVSWREKPIGGFIWRHVLKGTDGKGEGRGSESANSGSYPHAQIELGIPRLSQGFSDQPNDTYESQVALPASVLTQPEAPSSSRRVLTVIAVVITPISVTVAISLLIALLDPLKGLFVNFEGGPSWEAPDGKPPLAFVIDTGPFVSLPSVNFSDSRFDDVKPVL
jgi:auxin efflux carrier family protein